MLLGYVQECFLINYEVAMFLPIQLSTASKIETKFNLQNLEACCCGLVLCQFGWIRIRFSRTHFPVWLGQNWAKENTEWDLEGGSEVTAMTFWRSLWLEILRKRCRDAAGLQFVVVLSCPVSRTTNPVDQWPQVLSSKPTERQLCTSKSSTDFYTTPVHLSLHIFSWFHSSSWI